MSVRKYKVVKECRNNCGKRVLFRVGTIIDFDEKHPSVRKWLRHKKIIEIKEG